MKHKELPTLPAIVPSSEERPLETISLSTGGWNPYPRSIRSFIRRQRTLLCAVHCSVQCSLPRLPATPHSSTATLIGPACFWSNHCCPGAPACLHRHFHTMATWRWNPFCSFILHDLSFFLCFRHLLFSKRSLEATVPFFEDRASESGSNRKNFQALAFYRNFYGRKTWYPFLAPPTPSVRIETYQEVTEWFGGTHQKLVKPNNWALWGSG